MDDKSDAQMLHDPWEVFQLCSYKFQELSQRYHKARWDALEHFTEEQLDSPETTEPLVCEARDATEKIEKWEKDYQKAATTYNEMKLLSRDHMKAPPCAGFAMSKDLLHRSHS